jgi:alpha-galactosidase
MTAAEYRTHMSLWALLAAPLIAGHDVRSSPAETVALLTNREVIAIDQDPLGRPGRRVVQRGPLEVWTRPLAGKRTAVALFNRGTAPATIEASLAELGIGGRAAAVDVWAQRSLVLERSVSADVEPHGVVLLVLEPSKQDEPSRSPGDG